MEMVQKRVTGCMEGLTFLPSSMKNHTFLHSGCCFSFSHVPSSLPAFTFFPMLALAVIACETRTVARNVSYLKRLISQNWINTLCGVGQI